MFLFFFFLFLRSLTRDRVQKKQGGTKSKDSERRGQNLRSRWEDSVTEPGNFGRVRQPLGETHHVIDNIAKRKVKDLCFRMLSDIHR